MEKWILVFMVLGGGEKEHIVGMYETQEECNSIAIATARRLQERKRINFLNICLPEDLYIGNRTSVAGVVR